MSPSSSRLPVAVYALAFGVFALVTSEFQVSALMTVMSQDLQISLPMTGYLITVYALAMALGAPLLTLLLMKQPLRRTLLLLLWLFVASQALASVANSYALLLVARILTGAIAGAFIGNAVSCAVQLVPPTRIAAAITVVLSGLMVGTVVGLPLASLIGNLAGWRISFWSVVVISLLALWLTQRSLPAQIPQGEISLQAELAALKNPRLWRAYSTSLLIIGATFAAFSYFTPILQSGGFSPDQVTLLLLAYGVATVAGNAVVGRLAVSHSLASITGGLLALAGCMLLFALQMQQPLVAIAAVTGIGLTGVTQNPAMVTRVIAAAGNRQLVNTLHTSMITLGIVLGSLAGGIGIANGYGLSAPLWTGVVMAGCGLLTLLPDLASRRKMAECETGN